MRLTTKILGIGIISLMLISCGDETSNEIKTSGTLTVSALTSEAGGNYAPRNIVAIWVENSSGVFVKSLLVYADSYDRFLTNWVSTSAYDRTDAVTGATVNNHDTRTCTWNGTDVNGNVVADGTYRVCMELTDKNSVGNYHYFEIVKDTISHSLTPANVASFSNISIVWTPQ